MAALGVTVYTKSVISNCFIFLAQLMRLVFQFYYSIFITKAFKLHFVFKQPTMSEENNADVLSS